MGNTARYGQRGLTLIVALIMLLLLTVIGLAAVRSANLEERMAGNQRDRALSFQAAEAALRAAEVVLNGAAEPAWGSRGYGDAVARGGSASFWSNTFDWAEDGRDPGIGLSYVAEQPNYFVEKIESKYSGGGPGSGLDFASQLNAPPETVLRVTARAKGMSNDTVVILQSTYKR